WLPIFRNENLFLIHHLEYTQSMNLLLLSSRYTTLKKGRYTTNNLNL
ncbi:unnamed protein product, partial [Brassica oleracea var. botrytis]